jgi:tRNA threonylcarbamoyladenosine biosynthesis protein TsaB
MQEARLEFADLDRIAVTRGPGTFTGVRAGIAAARGLALACGAAVVTATSLEVMALACRERLGTAECASGFVVAHDARRGEFYMQSFGAEADAVSVPVLATAGEAARIAAPFGIVAGSGARAVAAEAERAGASLRFALPDLLPDAIHLARLAMGRPPSDKPAAPLYLRAPDAKPQMDKHLARV